MVVLEWEGVVKIVFGAHKDVSRGTWHEALGTWEEEQEGGSVDRLLSGLRRRPGLKKKRRPGAG